MNIAAIFHEKFVPSGIKPAHSPLAMPVILGNSLQPKILIAVGKHQILKLRQLSLRLEQWAMV